MREIFHIHIGQAGVQLGEHCWKLYCLEHGIGADGALVNKEATKESRETLFADTGRGRYVPRAIFVDTDPSVVDALRKGAVGELFHPAHLLTHKEDAASNFAHGFYESKQLLQDTLEQIRRLAETSNSLQGFVIANSAAGGTGSGFAAVLLRELKANFNRKSLLQLLIAPSPDISSVVVEPYNAVLHAHSTLDYVDCTFLVDNQALYKLCRNQLAMNSPSYDNLNPVIAQSLSSIMNSVSSGGQLNVDLNEFQTNLVPFQRLHFTMMSYAPLISAKRQGSSLEPPTDEITRDLFRAPSRLLTCDPQTGRYISCGVLYRGDVSQRHVQETLSRIRMVQNLKIVDWSPATFKIGVSGHSPCVIPGSDFEEVSRSACMLSNSTALASVWRNVRRKFRPMFAQNAFVHWYLKAGLEISELEEAYEDIKQLEADYTALNSTFNENDSKASRTDGL